MRKHHDNGHTLRAAPNFASYYPFVFQTDGTLTEDAISVCRYLHYEPASLLPK